MHVSLPVEETSSSQRDRRMGSPFFLAVSKLIGTDMDERLMMQAEYPNG
jgi:hypothetical protein